jgi:leucine dehydrogenase
MGRFVESLNGRYHTADDMGTTVTDMDVLREETRFAHGIADGSGNPLPATAFGVFAGIRAAVAQRLGRDDLDGVGVAIQGLGNVGARLARYLTEAGARLWVADIDPTRVERAADELGARAVSPEYIHAIAADVFAPCAAGAIINDRTLRQIRASVVAGAANNQLDKPRHGAALKEKGILYAPDYVINAGGLIDVACEGPDYDPARVLERVAGIYDTAREVFGRARVEDAPTNLVADRMVRARLSSHGQSTIAA